MSATAPASALPVGITKTMAEHVSTLRFDRLPGEAIHAFRRALVDYLACTIAGSRTDAARQVYDYLASWDSSTQACIVGTSERLSCQNAAFVNGTAAHGLDFDDGYTRGSVHAAGAVFPALLAMAERLGSSAEDVIAAGVAGYDVTLRLAAAVHPHSARRGYHNTPTCGVFGATAAAGRLLGLDPKTIQDALGIAGSFSGGLREYLEEGAEVKRVHPGKAARDGITCAELALRGLTGPSKILEGKRGIASVLSGGNADLARITSDLGVRFEICDAYFKPYPACRHFHSALDAVRTIAGKRQFRPADVRAVEIGMYEVGVQGHDHKHADSLLDAQMSAPVATALAVVLGDVTATSFDRANLENREVRRIIDATTVFVDPECERIYPTRRSGVARITFADGTHMEERVLDPKGEGENPMTDDDLTHKLRSNCTPIVGAEKTERVLAAAWSLGRDGDIGEFFRW